MAETSSDVIENAGELIAYLEQGCKPEDEWRIGTEHEKFGFRVDDLRPPPYEGERGIEAVLHGLASLGWNEIKEEGRVIALACEGCSITLEPGGQLELSGAPLKNLHETCSEVNHHLKQVKQVCEPLGLGFLGMGFQPKWRRDDMPWMPKARYKIMRQYMPRVGSMGLDMMVRTCTVQVNLDFASESDMIQKFRVGLALQPIATALFANSPFVEGQPSGYVSHRSHVWTDTDPDRSGMLPMVFEDGMGFERWVDYLLDVPMYFVMRNNRYVDASGQSFRDFMRGKLAALPGELPTLNDFKDHMTTVFPEVRLKTFLEMRGADGGPWRRICALPAFWVGLLYDQGALDAAWDLVSDWTADDRQTLRAEVPRLGMQARVRGRSVLDVSRETLAIARAGLASRGCRNDAGDDETGFLNTLEEVVTDGQTPAERKLEMFHGRWNGNIDRLFEECQY